jgi:hypothetical protein
VSAPTFFTFRIAAQDANVAASDRHNAEDLLNFATRQAAQVRRFDGVAHVNIALESGYLAATGDHLWVLADATASDAVRPSVTRIPLGELSSTPLVTRHGLCWPAPSAMLSGYAVFHGSS